MRGRLLLVLLAAWSAAGVAASAPLRACTPPAHVSPAPAKKPPDREVVRDTPVASYMLALSWSPEWCRTRGGSAEARFQCRQNHMGFVVHGLWPNGPGKRHPRYCAPAPAINAATVRKNYCMTPSADLLQHEWAAHGTCGWKTPEAYFDRARALWNAIDAPSLSFPAGKEVTAGDVRDAFLARNRALRRNALYVKVGRQSPAGSPYMPRSEVPTGGVPGRSWRAGSRSDPNPALGFVLVMFARRG